MKKDFEETNDRDVQTGHEKKKKTIVQELKELREELGEDASEEEVEEEIEEIMQRYVAEYLERMEEKETEEETPDDGLSEEDRKYMEDATGTVREFLDAHQWNYGERAVAQGVRVFEMGFSMKNATLNIRIFIETDPKVCRIVVGLPVKADPIYEYLLCKAMATENYTRRFGGFKYDERDGEMTYEYTFLALHGIAPDELDIYFNAVMSSASGGYDAIRKCCVGRFKKKEIGEILEKINDLVNDISDEE